MDIKLTHSLLTKYLDTKASPEEIAQALSLCGPTVDRLEKVDNDWVYDIEVITNRVDAASAYGIAREASAILPESGHQAKLKPIDLSSIKKKVADTNLKNLDIEVINNPDLNPRILAIKISNVTVKPSPHWMQNTLEKIGQRPLNNIIDITNYVMFELGHPVHAFDYDRLTEKKIIVREAKKGEKVTTLDEKTHTMRGGEMVYDDGTGTIVDLPGIMGTANSVITNDTKNVLLWIEDCNGKKIRFASLLHQIRTQAAILGEKRVDPELSYPAILRATELIVQLANGEVGSKVLDIYPNPVTPHDVELDLTWLKTFIGFTIPTPKIIEILERLGFKVNQTNDTTLVCTVPTWRKHDITIREDLAEEITRVYGYYRLASVIPKTDLPSIGTSQTLELEYQARNYMANLGFTEIYNSSLVSKEIISQTDVDENRLFKLQNPLSEDYNYLRPSLIPSLLSNLEANRGFSTIKLFELSNVYHKSPRRQLAHEPAMLAFAIVGEDYRKAKGYLDSFLKTFNVKYTLVKPTTIKPFDVKKTASIKVGEKIIGHIGVVNNVVLAEINFSEIVKNASLIHHFTPIPTNPPIIEDLTFTLPSQTEVGPVISTLKAANKLIEQVDLKTIYQQNYTFTFTYRSSASSLTNDDVAPIRQQIVDTMDKQFNSPLVGKLQ